MRRDDICIHIHVSPANRARLCAIIADRNSPRKVVWRVEIALATADGLGTNTIMRRRGKSKPCVWSWQERYMEEGIEGLKRDKNAPRVTGSSPVAGTKEIRPYLQKVR
jgi:hypothetical protein